MSLSDQTKDQFQLLVDLNEPEALLATMARFARRASDGLMVSSISQAELKRWRSVADALIKAEAEVSAMSSPERAKLEAHLKEWSDNEDKPTDAAKTAGTSPTGAGEDEDRPLPA